MVGDIVVLSSRASVCALTGGVVKSNFASGIVGILELSSAVLRRLVLLVGNDFLG